MLKFNNIIYSINETEKIAIVIGNDSAFGSVLIPRSINFKNQEFIVTKIQKKSFQDSKITSIEFPSNSELRVIEGKSFSNSTIESITIPSSVSELQEEWCHKTRNLININLHHNNPHFKKHENQFILGKTNEKSDNFDVFIFAPRNLTSITIPSNIKIISPYSFENKNIKKIDIPSHVTKIMQFAFSSCTSLSEVNFTVDSELKTIEKGAFNKTDIEKIKFPPNLCDLQDEWCYKHNFQEVSFMSNNPHFKNFENKIILGKTNEKEDNEEFDSIVFANKEIESITIPSNIKKILPYAFAYNYINKIEFLQNSNLQIIGKCAFFNSRIRKIFIPRSVKIICKGAFQWCSGLKNIEFSQDSELQTIEAEAFSYSMIEKLSIPSNVVELQTAWCWAINFEVKIMENNSHFKNFGDMVLGKSNDDLEEFDVIVFSKRSVKNIIIPSFIKKIAPYSFAKSSITDIFLPKQVTEIQEGAFDQCHSLHNVEIEKNSELKLLEKFCFLLTKICEFYIPSHLKEINKRAFYSCNNLQKVMIPNDSELQIIKADAFANTSIKSLFIPKCFMQISDGAFLCRSLQIVQIEDCSKVQLNIKKVFGENSNAIIMIQKPIEDYYI